MGCYIHPTIFELYISMGLGSVVDVALASEAEGCGFDPPTGRQVPTTACGSPINWAVTWLWSVVKRLELSEIRRYISLQIIIIILVCHIGRSTIYHSFTESLRSINSEDELVRYTYVTY